MRAATLDIRCQPFRNGDADAGVGHNAVNGATVEDASAETPPPPRGEIYHSIRLTGMPDPVDQQWGPYRSNASTPVGSPIAVSLYVYSNRPRPVYVRQERLGGGVLIDVLEGWQYVEGPVGIASQSTTTVTCYTRGENQLGDIVAIAALVARPAPWHSQWSPGEFIYPS